MKAICLIVLVSLWSPLCFAQSRGRLDMRDQLAPITAEQLDATHYQKAMVGGGLNAPLTLSVTLQSIGPVSEKTLTAPVEMLLVNTGRVPYRLPVSREMKILHSPSNQDRRIFHCSIRLADNAEARTITSPALFSEQGITAGLRTYSASDDPGSTFLLKPQESLVLRFDASFQLAWTTGQGRWKDGIKAGLVQGAAQCHEEQLRLAPNTAAADRNYSMEMTQPLMSNWLPLTLAP